MGNDASGSIKKNEPGYICRISHHLSWLWLLPFWGCRPGSTWTRCGVCCCLPQWCTRAATPWVPAYTKPSRFGCCSLGFVCNNFIKCLKLVFRFFRKIVQNMYGTSHPGRTGTISNELGALEGVVLKIETFLGPKWKRAKVNVRDLMRSCEK